MNADSGKRDSETRAVEVGAVIQAPISGSVSTEVDW